MNEKVRAGTLVHGGFPFAGRKTIVAIPPKLQRSAMFIELNLNTRSSSVGAECEPAHPHRTLRSSGVEPRVGLRAIDISPLRGLSLAPTQERPGIEILAQVRIARPEGPIPIHRGKNDSGFLPE